MTRLRFLIAVFCLLLMLPTSGRAQEQPIEPDEETRALEKQAYEMLYSIAESVPSLRSSDNRIYLTAAVAELLWTKDETRARTLFETLIKEINTVMVDLDPADQRAINTVSMMQQQRREIIERISRRDPDMALSFLHATRPPQEMLARINDFANENNLELYLVSQVAQKEPERALKLARASLKKGMTSSMVSVLLNIASKNPDAARTLHVEMVERLR
ncbi:MAG TPA: hypothetical protein VJS64_11840, partial [Pyrinomonadaceae bacterium]|nr:hypothetical protein [Pyrinomonadaceae bacterium]